MNSIKDMVKDGKRVRFTKYLDGNLYYKTEDDFEFPVPISDIGNATFLAEDKAILFMRYIRKQVELIEKGFYVYHNLEVSEITDVFYDSNMKVTPCKTCGAPEVKHFGVSDIEGVCNFYVEGEK